MYFYAAASEINGMMNYSILQWQASSGRYRDRRVNLQYCALTLLVHLCDGRWQRLQVSKCVVIVSGGEFDPKKISFLFWPYFHPEQTERE